MYSRLRPLAMALVVASPLVLAGCEKPNPGVTVWSGTNSEHEQALCWQPDERAVLGPRDCAQDVLEKAGAGEGIPRIELAPGDVVGISVDPVVADSGWNVQISGQAIASGLTDTYFRFTFPEGPNVDTTGTGYTLQVIATAQPTGSRGYWFFQLVPR